MNSPEHLARIPELEGKILGCWCAPQACHGDVLAELANQQGEQIMSKERFTIAGTGSRKLQIAAPEKKRWVYSELIRVLSSAKEIHGGKLWVMSGMAEGFDKALATAAIQLEIPLHCAIPTKTYGHWYWGGHSETGEDMEHMFNVMIGLAADVTYVMEDIYGTSSLYLNGKHANFVRNDWMVENADYFVVYDPSSPGTSNAFATIKRSKKPFLLLNLPQELKS